MRPIGSTRLAEALDSAMASAPFFSFRALVSDRPAARQQFLRQPGAHARGLRSSCARAATSAAGARSSPRTSCTTAKLVRQLARSKCNGLFVGLESLDRELLRRQNKTQNLGRRDVIEDIAYAESLGIGITYGYLFDPRHQTAAEMRRQIETIARPSDHADADLHERDRAARGTKAFWDDVEAGSLAPDLRLRDLDGETIAYARSGGRRVDRCRFPREDVPPSVGVVVDRRGVLIKTIRRIMRSGTLNPIRWYLYRRGQSSLLLVVARNDLCPERTYMAGSDTLDPQYLERPPDLSDEDRARYFDPIALTDSSGAPAAWLKPYLTSRARRATREARVDE